MFEGFFRQCIISVYFFLFA